MIYETIAITYRDSMNRVTEVSIPSDSLDLDHINQAVLRFRTARPNTPISHICDGFGFIIWDGDWYCDFYAEGMYAENA